MAMTRASAVRSSERRPRRRAGIEREEGASARNRKRANQKRYRGRQRCDEAVYPLVLNDADLLLLIDIGWFTEAEASDRRAVAEAIQRELRALRQKYRCR